jgi:hypothetical protein
LLDGGVSPRSDRIHDERAKGYRKRRHDPDKCGPLGRKPVEQGLGPLGAKESGVTKPLMMITTPTTRRVLGMRENLATNKSRSPNATRTAAIA